MRGAKNARSLTRRGYRRAAAPRGTRPAPVFALEIGRQLDAADLDDVAEATDDKCARRRMKAARGRR